MADITSGNLLVSGALVVAGWVVGHRLNVWRDTIAKRRDLRVQYLVDAYRRLEAASNRDPAAGDEGKAAFESAVADIQLFGTTHQVDAVLKFMEAGIVTGGSNITPLLEIIRLDLRRELGLDTEIRSLKVFRFTDDHSRRVPPTSKRSSPRGVV